MERLDMSNGHLGLSSVETLYTHPQKIYIKTRRGEEKTRILRITIELKSGLTISLAKVLSLQITDDSDSTFYYSLLLTQEDFGVLKCQQGLLVDFDHFPAQLIKLLEACNSQELSKFILVLDEEDSINPPTQPVLKDYVFLKVIETNNFKNLCHLSLKVHQGSDADIKNHMSLKISNLKEKLFQEEKKNRAIETNLAEVIKALEAKTKELSEIQARTTEEKNSLRLEMRNQISEEREKVSKMQMEWQQKLEQEKSQLTKHYVKQINDMNEQINLLTFNNKNLYEAKCQFETSVKEKNFQIDTLEKQIAQLTQETAVLRKQNSQLDLDYHEKDKMVIGLKTKLAVVEQELKDQGKFLDKQQELLKSANEQKTFLEEALNEKEAHLQRKVAAVQTLSADLMKSNEIIAKLQTDLAGNKAKMKLRTDIALEQEKILEKKNQQIAVHMEAIKELEDRVMKATEELQATRTQLEEANKKIEEKEVIIKKNDNVINWLNRRLTESTTTTSAPTSNLISSRTGSDSIFSASQPKGNISNLTKSWPPWLIHSVGGSNSTRGDSTEVSCNGNGIPSSKPVDMLTAQSKRLQIPEETTTQPENGKVEGKGSTEPNKPRGLDPKYFQSSLDKDYMANSQPLKVNNKETWKPSTCKSSSSRPTSVRQPTSAYFPKKPVQS